MSSFVAVLNFIKETKVLSSFTLIWTSVKNKNDLVDRKM